MKDRVSRETSSGSGESAPLSPPPEALKGAFSSPVVATVVAYAELLATEGVVRGLIGPREVPRLWTRHVLNCAALSPLIDDGLSVCDVGSGAGLPGLVLAIQRPDLRVTLVEPLLRRTTFLDEVVDQLALSNVEVIRGRADSLHGERVFDVVTSRAVAPLDRLLRWCMPLVDSGAEMVALKGSSVRDEIIAARDVLEAFGCAEPAVESLTADPDGPPTYAVRVTRRDPRALPLALGPESDKRAGSKRRRKAPHQGDRRRPGRNDQQA